MFLYCFSPGIFQLHITLTMVLYLPESLWTSFADGRVRLRIDNSCPQTPITVHQMFKDSLEKYGSLNALASKKNGKWEKITFSEYYCLSRKAAKSFLKELLCCTVSETWVQRSA
uniref:Uncharacterized protein n=1 Tax=Zosterops lateralis melanops TaxID=1220523 RepID=A0A8D2QVD0_ZOSLA